MDKQNADPIKVKTKKERMGIFEKEVYFMWAPIIFLALAMIISMLLPLIVGLFRH